MRRTRYRPQRSRARSEAGLGRMLLASLGIHVVVLALFSGVLLPRLEREQRPVYYVDLVNLPVKDPQAGRPDARPKKAAPQPAPKKPEPAKTAVSTKKPAAKPKPPLPKKPAVKKEPAPQQRYADTLSAIEQLKRKKEIEDLKEHLAALAASDSRRTPAVPEAPVGMPEGKGSEAGTSYDAWLHTFLKQAWTLSKYQVSRQNLEATVLLVFDARGRMVDYRMLETSGEERFDDSVKKAVLQLKELPSEPGGRLEREVVFNLKDLLE